MTVRVHLMSAYGSVLALLNIYFGQNAKYKLCSQSFATVFDRHICLPKSNQLQLREVAQIYVIPFNIVTVDEYN